MSYEVEVNSIFTKSTNRDYAQQLVNFIAEQFKDASINLSNVPDIRFQNSGGVFFRIKKSCAVDFFLDRYKDYDYLKKTTDKSTHTHSLTGEQVMQLIDSNFNILKYYVEQSYSNVKNR